MQGNKKCHICKGTGYKCYICGYDEETGEADYDTDVCDCVLEEYEKTKVKTVERR